MRNRIRELRQRANLTMQALAERAGTSAPQINKLEKGERKLTVDWMVRLGRALGVDAKGLMAADAFGRPPPSLPSSLNAISVEFGPPDLPILGRAQGGPNGVLIIPTE